MAKKSKNEKCPEEQNIRCLCHRCLQDYFSTNKYIIKRFNPNSEKKDNCFICDKPGFDYVLSEKDRH